MKVLDLLIYRFVAHDMVSTSNGVKWKLTFILRNNLHLNTIHGSVQHDWAINVKDWVYNVQSGLVKRIDCM